MGNNDKFSFIDLYYGPVKNVIKEELPLSECFPNTFNPNKSKYYYSNVNLNQSKNLNFEVIIKNIEVQNKKFNNNLKTVILFDNISILSNDEQTIIDEINNLLKILGDLVKYFLLNRT